MLYFITVGECCSEAYSDYFTALDELRRLDANTDLDARLIAIDQFEAGPYLRMPRLRTAE